jgi:hypothetical protein
MPTEQILALLVAERDRLNQAIEALQGPARRRGRPPKQMAMTESMPAEKPRRKRSAAERKAQSERMKKYWAERRKEAKGKG